MKAVYISIPVPISALSDEMTIEKGVLAKIHAELLAKIPGTARALDREIASPEEARQIFGLGA